MSNSITYNKTKNKTKIVTDQESRNEKKPTISDGEGVAIAALQKSWQRQSH